MRRMMVPTAYVLKGKGVLMGTGGTTLESSFPATRILVAGGSGFIGHHLVGRLLDAGHQVVVLDDLSTGSRGNLPAHPALSFYEGSVLDQSAVVAAAKDCDMVVNLAGVVGKTLALLSPDDAYETSVAGTRHLLASAPGVPVILFTSAAVYGLDGKRPTRESSSLSDADVLAYDGGTPSYAMGKLEMERIGAFEADRGRPVMVIRPFNIVGPNPGRCATVLHRFVKNALEGEPLVIHGDGRQTRSFSHISVFLGYLFRLVRLSAAWRPPRNVINIGTPKSTSVRRLAEFVLSETASTSPVRFVPFERAYPGQLDVRARVPDVRRLERLAGKLAWPGIRSIVGELCAGHARARPRNGIAVDL